MGHLYRPCLEACGDTMKKTLLASRLSRRVVLKVASAVVLGSGCGEGAAELLVDGTDPIGDPHLPYPLDTDGDDEMSQPVFFSKLYDPLLLYAQAIVQPGSGVGPNVAGLANPHGLPMKLLEVRWRIYPNNTSGNNFATLTGMGIGVKLDMGNIPLVDADVPLNGFGTSRDDDDSLFFSATEIYPNPDDPTVTTNPNAYRWRLKYPLYVPPGCVVTPVYSHLGQNPFPVTVDTIYVARTLPMSHAPSAAMWAPWVGSYNSISFDNLASQPAGRDFSSELDIVNPFRQPLEIARLTGRAASVIAGAGGIQSVLEDFEDHRFVLGKVRIRARSGDELARTPTPFNGLWPFTWRAWDIPGGWMMRPGEFYKVQLTVDETEATAPIDPFLGTVQYAVTGIGYRKLPLRVFLDAAKGGST